MSKIVITKIYLSWMCRLLKYLVYGQINHLRKRTLACVNASYQLQALLRITTLSDKFYNVHGYGVIVLWITNSLHLASLLCDNLGQVTKAQVGEHRRS